MSQFPHNLHLDKISTFLGKNWEHQPSWMSINRDLHYGLASSIKCTITKVIFESTVIIFMALKYWNPCQRWIFFRVFASHAPQKGLGSHIFILLAWIALTPRDWFLIALMLRFTLTLTSTNSALTMSRAAQRSSNKSFIICMSNFWELSNSPTCYFIWTTGPIELSPLSRLTGVSIFSSKVPALIIKSLTCISYKRLVITSLFCQPC